MVRGGLIEARLYLRPVGVIIVEQRQRRRHHVATQIAQIISGRNLGFQYI